MTRDDIIKLAREAGLLNCDCCLPFWEEDDQENWKRFFVNFAALILAAEREAIAQMIEDAPTLVESNKHGGCLMCGFTPKLAAAFIRARGKA